MRTARSVFFFYGNRCSRYCNLQKHCFTLYSSNVYLWYANTWFTCHYNDYVCGKQLKTWGQTGEQEEWNYKKKKGGITFSNYCIQTSDAKAASSLDTKTTWRLSESKSPIISTYITTYAQIVILNHILYYPKRTVTIKLNCFCEKSRSQQSSLI